MSIKDIINTIETSKEIMDNTKKSKEIAELKLEAAIMLSYPEYRKLKDIKSKITHIDHIDCQDVNNPIAQRMQRAILSKINIEIDKYRSDIIAAESLYDPKISLSEK
jgi:hypothetical protein